MSRLPSLARIAVIARKEILVLLGNKVSRMLIIVPPLAQIIIFGWAATLEVKNVHAAYLNHDNGLWSARVLNGVKGSPTFESLVSLSGEAEVKKIMDAGEALFTLVFPADFSRNIASGEPASLQIILDGRRSNAAQIVAGYLNEIVDTVVGEISPNNARGGVRIVSRCLFNPNLNFQWFFLPNLIGMISLILGLVVTGLSVARERERGTFDQLLMTPASPTEIALGKLIPGCLIGVAHGTIFILVAVFGFGVPLRGSLLLLYAATLIFAFAAGSAGLMISSLSSTQQQAFLGAFTVGVPCILLSGAITPVINMPESLRHLTLLNPLRHFTVICQGVFLKDITPEAAVKSLLAIIVIGAAAAAVAIRMFERR